MIVHMSWHSSYSVYLKLNYEAGRVYSDLNTKKLKIGNDIKVGMQETSYLCVLIHNFLFFLGITRSATRRQVI